MKHNYFIRLQQVWKDLKVRKALWELWEPWENRVTQAQPGHQGPQARRDPQDLLQLNPQHMQPPLVHQARQVKSITLELKKIQNITNKKWLNNCGVRIPTIMHPCLPKAEQNISILAKLKAYICGTRSIKSKKKSLKFVVE